MRTSVANSVKELQGYEQQQKITMQALDRESSQLSKEQKQVDIIRLRTKQLCQERYLNLVELEEQGDNIENQMEEKARQLKQRHELQNLMKSVEINVEPKRFKAMLGGANGQSSSLINPSLGVDSEQVLDFESAIHEPSKCKF